jgi:cellulose synthase/poly-beta-1,6-N-acetylglucosamine synthase-like glycosyltransferase
VLPKVSCLCPTYARAYLLEEAIESFHRQDYPGEKELVVCNDFRNQTFVYSHPEVKLLNFENRFKNLGEKRHETTLFATGEWFLTWGDDDLHLSRRISRMVEYVMEQQVRFALEGPHYCYINHEMKRNEHPTVGAHIIHRDLYQEAGGFPRQDIAEDLDFNRTLERMIGRLPCCKAPPQFVYRWSSERPHISAVGGSKEHRHRTWDRMEEVSMELIAKGKEPTGTIELHPHWKRDWEELARVA